MNMLLAPWTCPKPAKWFQMGPMGPMGPTDGWTDGRVGGRTNWRTDGWADGQTDGQPGGRADGRADLYCFLHILYLYMYIICICNIYICIHMSIYLASVSSSSKSPSAAKHTIGCTPRWQYVCPKLQKNIWHERQVMANNVLKRNFSWQNPWPAPEEIIHIHVYMWEHLEASGVIWRYPGDTQEASRRRHQGRPTGCWCKMYENHDALQQEMNIRVLSRRQERRDPHQVRSLQTKMSGLKRGIAPPRKHPFPRHTARTPTEEAVWGTIMFDQTKPHEMAACVHLKPVCFQVRMSVLCLLC